ncbi:MAG: D-ribose pyranase [Clostridiales bacterium]|nr:MAG: D-ribose pyranase [Clostridiales bacterium]
MLKGKLLNSNIMAAISKMGHTDRIAIADAGLPIPEGVERIDIALTRNMPTFRDTAAAVAEVMEIEKVILAEEIKTNNKGTLEWIMRKFADVQVEFVVHEDFKALTAGTKAVVRTGECTPYANIILQSGVDFSGE